MITRRVFTTTLAGAAFTSAPMASSAAASRLSELPAKMRAIERAVGGRLGVAIVDTADGSRAGHRQDERFPMCSTFKALAAAAVLRRVDAGAEQLDRRIAYGKDRLLAYSPTTSRHADGPGLTIAELCEAAVTLSDNTAANLLLQALGGPGAVTRLARELGDTATRLDRIEPALNEAAPGDPRDTTTPAAMARLIGLLVLGDALQPLSRDRLTAWLVGCKTGDARLRAGLPGSWKVGDKTGTGPRGTANDIGIVWPPERKPIIAAVYLTGARAAAPARDAAIAGVARALSARLAA